MGHLLASSGLKPDPEKVHAVKEMPVPGGVTRGEKVNAVQRFLGFVNYLAKFLPKLSDACEPLRRLTDKNIIWHWEKHHQKAFERVKEMVINFPVLRYYDVNLPVTIQCDSSDIGLGAVLMQEDRAVAFASRTLTKVDRNSYAPIEKEFLVITFACYRFEQYIYRKENVIVESDHKPLQVIFGKPLVSVPRRLPRNALVFADV